MQLCMFYLSGEIKVKTNNNKQTNKTNKAQREGVYIVNERILCMDLLDLPTSPLFVFSFLLTGLLLDG